MRKNLKSLAPTLWFVIIAFIISIFAVWGGAGRLGEGQRANTLATVGKAKISGDIYFQSLRQRLETMKREFADLDSNFIQQLNIPQQVLEQIIQQTILLQLANDMGIRASDEELREKIKSYPVFQQDGKFIGFGEYKKILEWNRLSISDFEQNLKKEIMLEKVIQVITSGISVAPEELWENYKKNNETAKLEYVILETDKVEFNEELQPSELMEMYEKNKDKYNIQEKREADYTFFLTDDLKIEIELSEQEIENYYQDNQSQFQEPEKIRVSRLYLPLESKEKELVLTEIKDILDRINKGEDFSELAKKLSKDEKAEEGGDWGIFDWRRLSSPEQNEIENLSLSEISDPVEIEDGVSLLKITEKEPAVQKPIEEVREQITTILKDQKARELVETKISQLEKSARKEKSLEQAAQKIGYNLKQTGLLKEGESIEDIDPSGSISSSLFNLEEKEISSPIYTYKGTGIAQLKSIEPSRPARFEEMEDEIKTELTAIKKKEAVLEKMKNIKSELNNKSLEQLAEKYELEYKTVEKHKRGQYLSVIGENQEIDRLAFSLSKEEASDPIEFANGYSMIRLLDRKEVTKEDLEKNKKTEKETLLETKRNKFFQSYLTKTREEKGVKIKYDLFLKINSDILSRYQKRE